jgi:hypothetical protein
MLFLDWKVEEVENTLFFPVAGPGRGDLCPLASCCTIIV